MYWDEHQTKSGNENMKNESRYFLESNFIGVERMFVLIYSNKNNTEKRYKAQRYYLPQGINKNHNIVIKGKNFYDQPIDSDIKRYKEIREI